MAVSAWLRAKIIAWLFEQPKLKIQRIPDMTHEEYQALTPEQKQKRYEHWLAYDVQFAPGEYPLYDQLTPGNQRYADSQRAVGYNPPGVYC